MFPYIIFILLSSAHAAVPVLSCQSPEGAFSPADLTVEPEGEEAERVSLAFKDGDGPERAYRTVTRKGAVDRQLRGGRLQIVMRGEKSRSSATITTQAALLVLQRGFDGRYTGRLAARSDVFEIVCN